jgi:hypothetical protein
MNQISTSPGNTNMMEIAIWVVTLFLVATGFRFAKQVIAVVLDKLYEFFILKNSSM